MEADWEFEVGGDAPVIDACWAGFVDLRRTPGAAWGFAEVKELPALAEALEQLNAPSSPVWTSKCDFYPALQPDEFDASEMDADELAVGGGSRANAVGCYIDILPKLGDGWSEPTMAEAACRQVCSVLGGVPLRCCRVDLIVRSAMVDVDTVGLGITAYISACGSGDGEARDALGSALTALADALCSNSTLQ
jgi:hypothetical protein